MPYGTLGTLNHVQVLTSGEAFGSQTLCSELVLGSLHARLFLPTCLE